MILFFSNCSEVLSMGENISFFPALAYLPYKAEKRQKNTEAQE